MILLTILLGIHWKTCCKVVDNEANWAQIPALKSLVCRKMRTIAVLPAPAAPNVKLAPPQMVHYVQPRGQTMQMNPGMPQPDNMIVQIKQPLSRPVHPMPTVPVTTVPRGVELLTTVKLNQGVERFGGLATESYRRFLSLLLRVPATMYTCV